MSDTKVDHTGWKPRDADETLSVHGNPDELCLATYDHYECTLPKGHACDHIASGTQVVYVRWAKE